MRRDKTLPQRISSMENFLSLPIIKEMQLKQPHTCENDLYQKDQKQPVLEGYNEK